MFKVTSLTAGLMVLLCSMLQIEGHSNCKPGWVLGPEDTCYLFSFGHKANSWEDGQEVCRRAGGRGLAILNNDAKAGFVSGYLFIKYRGVERAPHWYVGGTRSDGFWRWQGDDDDDVILPIAKFHWGAHDPHGIWRSLPEECLAIGGDIDKFLWIDISCTGARYYVCEGSRQND